MSCCKDSNEAQNVSAENQAICPVMGSPVDKKVAESQGLVREYKGEKYYFCCAGCPEKFDKDPESFIEKVASSGGTGGCC